MPFGPTFRIATFLFVAALANQSVAQAECATVTLKKGEKLTGPVAKPTLVFSGTVTATNLEKYTVSFKVDRVWKGQLHRETTILAAPNVLEGAEVRSFRLGESYLVTSHIKPYVYSAEEIATGGLPAGTLGMIFACE